MFTAVTSYSLIFVESWKKGLKNICLKKKNFQIIGKNGPISHWPNSEVGLKERSRHWKITSLEMFNHRSGGSPCDSCSRSIFKIVELQGPFILKSSAFNVFSIYVIRMIWFPKLWFYTYGVIGFPRASDVQLVLLKPTNALHVAVLGVQAIGILTTKWHSVVLVL